MGAPDDLTIPFPGSSGAPSRKLRPLERILFWVGVLCVGYGVWTWADAQVYQIVEGRRLDALVSDILAGRAEMPRGGASKATLDPNTPVGRIEIERIGVSAIIAEGVEARTLRRAVGHVVNTALPGEPGNVVLAGHRDSFFHRLGEVRAGDRVRLITPEGAFTYDVDSTDVVGRDRVDLLEASEDSVLTLITCYPFNYVGPAPDRFVVRARLAG